MSGRLGSNQWALTPKASVTTNWTTPCFCPPYLFTPKGFVWETCPEWDLNPQPFHFQWNVPPIELSVLDPPPSSIFPPLTHPPTLLPPPIEVSFVFLSMLKGWRGLGPTNQSMLIPRKTFIMMPVFILIFFLRPLKIWILNEIYLIYVLHLSFFLSVYTGFLSHWYEQKEKELPFLG